MFFRKEQSHPKIKSNKLIHSSFHNRRVASSKDKEFLKGIAAVVVIVIAAAYFGIGGLVIPDITPASVANPTTTVTIQTSSTPAGAANSACTANSIQSKLTTYNSLSITSGTVTVYQQGASGSYTKLPDASSSQTLNTLNTASAPYSPPWVTVWNASAYYPETVQVSGGIGSSTVPLTNVATGQVAGSIICSTNAGSSNNIPTYQETGLLYSGPASGTTATTNVESVVNSQTSQTNSFPSAFPQSAAQTENVYLQLFANSIVAMQPVALPGSTNSPITNYGGMNGQPATSTSVTSGLVYYGGYAIVAFNQTQVAFTGPAGTVPLTVHGVSGVVAWLVPVTACGPTNTSGTGTANPFTGCSISFSVQENIATTGHHIDMTVIWADNTQAGYIEQYFTSPAVTSFPSATNHYGIPTGFSGIVPPTTSNAPHPIIEGYSSVIASW